MGKYESSSIIAIVLTYVMLEGNPQEAQRLVPQPIKFPPLAIISCHQSQYIYIYICVYDIYYIYTNGSKIPFTPKVADFTKTISWTFWLVHSL